MVEPLTSKFMINCRAANREDRGVDVVKLVAVPQEGNSDRYDVNIEFAVVHNGAAAVSDGAGSYAVTEEVLGLARGQASGLAQKQVQELFRRFEAGETECSSPPSLAQQ
ncbi:MAG: hypothetical protein H7831_03010 [Magnetococcus sp. WYHC-3]